MSRIGKQPIPIPEGVSIEFQKSSLKVKGPKGELFLNLSPFIEVVQEDNLVLVKAKSNDRAGRAMHGTTRTLIANMIAGVTEGWEKTLELVGIGNRAKLEGEDLVLTVGFSHPVTVKPPQGIKFSVNENRITVSGINKALVGQVAANIRAVKKPEPYKGKGIRYFGEKIKTKPGKAAKVGPAVGQA
jgi:large subunit ribosomal protein L6